MHLATVRSVVIVSVADPRRRLAVERERVTHPVLSVRIVRWNNVPQRRRDRRDAGRSTINQPDIVAHRERVQRREHSGQRPRPDHNEPPGAAAFASKNHPHG